MNGSAAIRALLLKDFAANSAELTADGITLLTIRQKELTTGNHIAVIGKTSRIRTKTGSGRGKHGSRFFNRGTLLHTCLKLDTELLGNRLDDFIIELRRLPLLEHRQRRLLTPDFRRDLTLRKTRGATGVAQLIADLGIQVRHWSYIMDFIFINFKGSDINNLAYNVDNLVDILPTQVDISVYKLIFNRTT